MCRASSWAAVAGTGPLSQMFVHTFGHRPAKVKLRRVVKLGREENTFLRLKLLRLKLTHGILKLNLNLNGILKLTHEILTLNTNT